MIETKDLTSAEFVASLDLEHIKGDQWVANTPTGRRVVTATTASFEPIIYYRDRARIIAAPVPGLQNLTQDREIPTCVWTLKD